MRVRRIEQRPRSERFPDRMPRRPARRRLRPRRQAPLQEDAAGRLQRRPALQGAAVRRTCSNSPGYTANVLALFQQERGLGLVYPPMIHIGYPTIGHAAGGRTSPGSRSWPRTRHPRARSMRSRRSRHTGRCTSRARRRCACSSSTSGPTTSSAAPRRIATAASRTSSSGCRRMPRVSWDTTRARSPTPSTSRQPHGARVQPRPDVRPRSPARRCSRSSFLRRLGPLGYGTLRDFAQVYIRSHRPAIRQERSTHVRGLRGSRGAAASPARCAPIRSGAPRR